MNTATPLIAFGWKARWAALAVAAFTLVATILFHNFWAMTDPAATWSFPASTRAIHLWNENWRREGRDKDRSYDPACLFEKLKARYGVRPSSPR